MPAPRLPDDPADDVVDVSHLPVADVLDAEIVHDDI